MKRALICGISGQDGSYLARLLLGKGYEVWGSSRDAQTNSFSGLTTLGIKSRVHLISMALNDFRSVVTAISRCKPDEIYNLAGQTSVGLSFEQPVETLESVTLGTLNLLEAIRFLNANVRFYNAGSSEAFGDTAGKAVNEQSPFQPKSPYAVAKAGAHWLVGSYRESYGLHACSGILFNHESPLRPTRFVTQKIVDAAVRIADGEPLTLKLGLLDMVRDWGWSEEYVEAMWRMLQHERPMDFVIATGHAYKLADFVQHAFATVGLDWGAHTEYDPSLARPNEIAFSCGDAGLASRELNWNSTISMPEVVRRMIDARRNLLGAAPRGI